MIVNACRSRNPVKDGSPAAMKGRRGMAHTCPDCGQTCYCGGDIEDCCHDLPRYVMRCNHYLKPDCDGYEGHDDEDDFYSDPSEEE